MTHICIINLTTIGSDQRQATIWTSAGILLIRPLATNYNEIHTFLFRKIHVKILYGGHFVSASMCLRLHEVRHILNSIYPIKYAHGFILFGISLQWRHNGCDGVSNHQPHHCLLNRLSSTGQRKHQSSASLAFLPGIHRWPVNSPHKGPVTRKLLPFDDVLMFVVVYLSPLRTDMM